jgi:hypothetical protein
MIERREQLTTPLCRSVPGSWPAVPDHAYAAWASDKCVPIIVRHFIDESNLEYYTTLQAMPILETAGSGKIDSIPGITKRIPQSV